MLKALDYKTKYRQLADELGAILNGTEYETRYNEFAKQFQNISEREKIHIVVVGNWSTGKSKLIKALTDDDSIGIDTAVKTDKPKIYEYNGVCIVDTPGLNSGNDEHTRLAENEINSADRIIYCITAQQQFTPTDIKEFVAIVNRFDSESKVILAVTKFGLEETGDEDSMSVLSRITSKIESVLEEKGIMDDQYDICIFSAERYIEGIKSKNDELVEASYFREFMDMIERPDDNNTKFLTWKKCRHQGELIDKFISEIMEEISSKYSKEEKNGQVRIDKRKEIQGRIEAAKQEAICVLKTKIIETKEFLLHADEDIDETKIKDEVEVKLASCLNEVSMYIRERFSQIEEGAFGIPGINNDVSLETKANNGKRSSSLLKKFQNTKIFGKAGDSFGAGIEKIDELAKPVKVGTKRPLFKKEVIMSERGGKGTALYDILTKRFPKHGAQMSVKLGKISDKLAGVGKFSSIAGAVLDVAIVIGGGVKEQSDENKKRHRFMLFRRNLISDISEIETLIEDEIEDQAGKISKEVDEKYIDTNNINGKLLSSLREKRMELRKLTDDFCEVGNYG